MSDPAEAFESFVRRCESRLRHALVARFGPDVGRDVAAEALIYGWENWDRVGIMDSPVGYLFRVGQSRAKKYRRSRRLFPAGPAAHEYEFEPELVPAINRLTDRQRTAVVLVHCYGWTLTEVAELLGVGVTTVQKHTERAMGKLRRWLEVSVDA